MARVLHLLAILSLLLMPVGTAAAAAHRPSDVGLMAFEIEHSPPRPSPQQGSFRHHHCWVVATTGEVGIADQDSSLVQGCVLAPSAPLALMGLTAGAPTPPPRGFPGI